MGWGPTTGAPPVGLGLTTPPEAANHRSPHRNTAAEYLERAERGEPLTTLALPVGVTLQSNGPTTSFRVRLYLPKGYGGRTTDGWAYVRTEWSVVEACRAHAWHTNHVGEFSRWWSSLVGFTTRFLTSSKKLPVAAIERNDALAIASRAAGAPAPALAPAAGSKEEYMTEIGKRPRGDKANEIEYLQSKIAKAKKARVEAEDLAFAWKLQAKEEELVEREQAEQATTEREELREMQAAHNRQRIPQRQTAPPSKRGTTGVAAAASEGEMSDCTICLRSLDEGKSVTPSCEHCFHDACLRQWLGQARAPNCPLCKKHISARRLQ